MHNTGPTFQLKPTRYKLDVYHTTAEQMGQIYFSCLKFVGLLKLPVIFPQISILCLELLMQTHVEKGAGDWFFKMQSLS
jgi:hypothetical protein